MTFRTWEQLTVVEQLQTVYSDFYKEVHGFRPRGGSDEQWNSQEWLEGAIDDLRGYAKIAFAQQAEEEANAVAQFERLVSDMIAMGARDRETALRWVMDVNDVGNDWEYLCFQYGLPYGYFKKAA